MTATPDLAPAPGLAALWAIRPYRRFWLTRVTTQTASQMAMVALGWQMYELTGSAWDLGLVGLAQFAPALVFTLPAGAMADRHRRSRILQATTVMQTLIALALVMGSLAGGQLGAFGGWLGRDAVLLLSMLLGVARAFQTPATQALPALLVPGDLLARAVALSSSGMQVAVIGGPALGGLLYAFGPAVVHGVCAGLLVIAFGCALGVVHARPVPDPGNRGWTAVWAGVHYLRGQPVLLGAISLDLFAVLLGGATALLPIYAKDILQVGPWGLGLLRAAPAVGALAMSIWLARRPSLQHAGPVLFGAVAFYGLCMIGFALSTWLWLSLAVLALSGAADMISVVVRQTLVQLETPDAMRGRVSAVNSVFIGASNQLGEFESGATAAAFGPVASVLLGGVGVLAVAGLWIRLFPDLWRRQALERRTA